MGVQGLVVLVGGGLGVNTAMELSVHVPVGSTGTRELEAKVLEIAGWISVARTSWFRGERLGYHTSSHEARQDLSGQ